MSDGQKEAPNVPAAYVAKQKTRDPKLIEKIEQKNETNRYTFVSDSTNIQKEAPNVPSELRLSAPSDCAPTVGPCLGSYGGPRGGGGFL